MFGAPASFRAAGRPPTPIVTQRQRHNQRRRRRSAFERSAKLVAGGVVSLALIGIVSLVAYVVSVTASTPDINHIKPFEFGRPSVIYAADGSRLGEVAPDAIRTPIPWGEVPVVVRRATVAIEDKRFYEHGGVDYQGILRAFFTDVVAGKSAQGGSSIAQQLVRAVYLKDPKHNISRKIREVKLATQLEQHHPKTWILWQYLNNVPYGTFQGRTALGIEAAAQLFFGRHASELTLGEAALLAGLPQAPSSYNPFQDPSAALRRRSEVLQAMVRQGFIDAGQARLAAREPLALHHQDNRAATQRREPYFFDYVQAQLIERYGIEAFRRGGFKVYTTVDPTLQKVGRQAIQSELGSPSDPSSSIVSIDPSTGYIRAMASSGNYGDRSFNLAAQGRRQPGSAFKTMVLTTAIRKGIDPDTTMYDSKPVSFEIPHYGKWTVRTNDGRYGGPMSITQATLRSDNTVYAQLDMDVGPHAVAQTAHLLGITSSLDGTASEGLGGLNIGVSPLEMASAYATLAAGGIRSKPQAILRVVLPDGHRENLGSPQRQRVIPQGVAYAVTRVLRQNVSAGTGTAASYGCPAAGKTGTTDRYRDAWFVGYTPTLASSIWVGYPNAPRPLHDHGGANITGSTVPARVFRSYMGSSGYRCRDFTLPARPAHFRPFHGHYAISGSGSGLGTQAPSITARNPRGYVGP
ncbi:MAG: PBP1A family penicillin-binding protein [Thermoleophilaceae bacterium]